MKQGKVRALGVTSGKRNPRLPNVPTIGEQGVPGYDVSSWYGVSSPAGVDKSIQAKIETDSLKVLAIADVKQRLTDLGVEVEPMNSAEFTAFPAQKPTAGARSCGRRAFSNNSRNSTGPFFGTRGARKAVAYGLDRTNAALATIPLRTQ